MPKSNRPFYPPGVPAAVERGIHPQLHSTLKLVDDLYRRIWHDDTITNAERLALLHKWEQAKADADLFARQSGYGE